MDYSNSKLDALLDAQQAAFPDKAQRIPMIKDALTILDNDVPGVPIYIATNFYLKQSFVKGLDKNIHAPCLAVSAHDF